MPFNSGKNGDNIRNMARISQAKISVDRNDDRSAKMVKIEITGSAASIANAKVSMFL